MRETYKYEQYDQRKINRFLRNFVLSKIGNSM